MQSSQFCYWLQGFFELSEPKKLSEKETQIIKNHLNLVFVHDLDPKEEAETGLPASHLQNIHDGKLPHEPKMRC